MKSNIGVSKEFLIATQKNIDDRDSKIAQLELALQKTVGILTNIRHETDYMSDSYYEWIDKVIGEVEELLPEEPEEII